MQLAQLRHAHFVQNREMREIVICTTKTGQGLCYNSSMNYLTRPHTCILLILHGKIKRRKGGASCEVESAGIPDFASDDNTRIGKTGRSGKE